MFFFWQRESERVRSRSSFFLLQSRPVIRIEKPQVSYRLHLLAVVRIEHEMAALIAVHEQRRWDAGSRRCEA